MKYLVFIAAIVMFTACGDNKKDSSQTTTENTDSLQKAQQAEEEEMSEEIIEGSFDALNR
ncbi:MAG: hypothetical protein H6551_12310 [Chitinophagales bacterium]|nr:hypothetical protein [Chitinophagaceae bacterium]MCB9065913.1 hypothetical protein [Chitinophagales bacterium]